MSGDPKKRRGQARPSRARLVLDAELLDTGLVAPKPGFVYVISIMRYRVITVVHGKYANEHVFVGHHVPNLASPEFRIGVRQRLQLTREFPKGSTTLNGFEEESRSAGVFFCLSFEVLSDEDASDGPKAASHSTG